MSAIGERLEAVQRQLNALQREVDELRALAGAATAEAELPPAFVNPDPSIFEIVTPVEHAEPPAAAAQPAIWPPPAPPSVRQRRERPQLTLPDIDLMSARALAVAGGVVTLLGVVLLFVLAVNRGWIGPEERVLFGALASAAAVGLGFLIRSRYGQYHSALAAVGAGIAGGYATLLAAVVLYDLVPQSLALVIAAGIAAVGVAIALLWDAQVVAALGLVGATLAPGAVALDSGITAAGTAFAAFVFAGTAVVAVVRDWRPLLVAGVVSSLPQAAALAASEPERLAGALAVTLGIAALYLAAGIAVQLRSAVGGLDRLAAVLVLLSAALSFASAAVLLGGNAENALLLSIAGTYGLLTAALFARDRDLAAVVAVAALTLGAVALARVLDGPALATVWAAEAAGLAWLAGRVRDVRYAAGALVYLVLGAVHALLVDAPPHQLYRDILDPAHGIAAPIAVLAGCLAVAAAALTWREPEGDSPLERLAAHLAAARRTIAHALAWVAGVLAAYAAALGILELVGDFEWSHVGVVALWAVAGGALLALSTRRWPGIFLVAGGVWLSAVALHVAWFALPTLGDPERGWAALALAVPALAGGCIAALAEPRPIASALAIVLSAGFGAVAAVELAAPGDPTGFSLLGAGATYAALAAALSQRPAARNAATLLWTIGLLFGLAAAEVLLVDTPFVAALACGAAALAALAATTGEGRLQIAAIAILALALGYTAITVAPPAELFAVNADPAEGAPAAFLVAAAAFAVALLARRERLRAFDGLDHDVLELQPRLRTAAAWTAGVTALYGLSLSVLGAVAWLSEADLDTEFQRGHTTVSAVWGAVGLVLLYLGLRRRWLGFRAAGFGLFGVSLAKIFLFDLSQLSSVARAVSFLAVGALLLTAGFFYQRLSRPA